MRINPGKIILAIAGITVGILQTSFVPVFFQAEIAPEITLAFGAALMLRLPMRDAWPAIISVALVGESVSVFSFGVFTIIYFLCIIIFHELLSYFDISSKGKISKIIALAIIVFLFSYFYFVVNQYLAMRSLNFTSSIAYGELLGISWQKLLRLVLTAVISIGFYLLQGKAEVINRKNYLSLN